MRRLLAAGLFVMASAASGQQASSRPAPDKPADPPPIVVQGQAEKKICHTETSTGSIMPVRVCRTPTQIAEQEAQAARYLEANRQLRETQEHVRALRNAP